MYTRSGFWYRGTSECALVPVFGTGEHPPKPPFWKLPFCEPPTFLRFLTPPFAILTPDIPQSEIAETIFYESGGSERENSGELLWASLNFSQNPSQFITPCLVNYMSKFHLPELLGLGGPTIPLTCLCVEWST